MNETPMPWQTDESGKLCAEANGYRMTVERLLPASDARFMVWGHRDQPRALISSGIRPNAKEAILSAERTAAALPRRRA